MVVSTSRGSGPIDHRISSFHREFSLNQMTRWRFEPPTFGAESLQIEPDLLNLRIFLTFVIVDR